MSILEIKERLPDFRDDFRTAARQTLTAQCFEPDGVERFLDRAESDAVPGLWLIDTGQGCRGFVGARAVSRTSLALDFIIPSCWRRRYFIIEQAILALQARPGLRKITMAIEETPPSHAAYFAGVLATLGFEMDARVRLSVGQETLQRVPLRALPAGFAEIDFTPQRLSDFAECFARGFAPFDDDWPPRSVRRDKAYWEEELADEGETGTWRRRQRVGIEHEGRVVGLCEGEHHETALFIRNIAVVPGHWRRGLGTYILIRCVQELRGLSRDPTHPVVLNARRGWQPAMAFYRRLGFRVTRIFTQAMWHREGRG